MDEDRSVYVETRRRDATIPRADPQWRESLRVVGSLLWQWAFPPVSSNFRPAPANCLPNRNVRFIRSITWKRYLPNRSRIIAMKLSLYAFHLDETPLTHYPFLKTNRIELNSSLFHNYACLSTIYPSFLCLFFPSALFVYKNLESRKTHPSVCFSYLFHLLYIFFPSFCVYKNPRAKEEPVAKDH